MADEETTQSEDTTEPTNGAQEAPKEKDTPPKQVTVTELELEQLRRDALDHKDKYLRLLAEQENTRKRLQKDREKSTEYVLQNIFVDFLNPIDHLEGALKFMDQMTGEVKVWGEGFKMILEQFKEVLNTNGVSPIHAVGKPFDPHFHEAIETVETDDYPPGIVVEEITRGYRMADRTIRPARVKVSKAPRKNDTLAEDPGKG
jgi:molecular chaperone GrpE